MAEQSDLREMEDLGHFVVVAEFCVFLASAQTVWGDVPRHRSLRAEIRLHRGRSHLPEGGVEERTCAPGTG